MAGKYFLQQREMSVEAQRYQWTEDHQRNFRQKKVEMTGKLEVSPVLPRLQHVQLIRKLLLFVDM